MFANLHLLHLQVCRVFRLCVHVTAEDSSGSRNSGGGGGGAGDGAPSSLDLSLRWEGIVLKDVELRRDFLSELLGLPVDVPHAFIRRAVLQLPWYTLMLG